jgi:hypothetical protein
MSDQVALTRSANTRLSVVEQENSTMDRIGKDTDLTGVVIELFQPQQL